MFEGEGKAWRGSRWLVGAVAGAIGCRIGVVLGFGVVGFEIGIDVDFVGIVAAVVVVVVGIDSVDAGIAVTLVVADTAELLVVDIVVEAAVATAVDIIVGPEVEVEGVMEGC